MSNDDQSIVQTTEVTKPVQDAVGLPIDRLQMRTEVDLDTSELVTSQWVLGGREHVPGASLGTVNVALVKIVVIRVPKLDHLSLIAEDVALHFSVDPVGVVLGHLRI